MLSLLIWLIIVCLVVAVVWWILQQIPVPPPMRMIINVVFGVICLIFLLYLAGSVVGPPHLGHLGD